jgi:hypothetical protein
MNQDAIGQRLPVQVLRGDRWLELALSPVELTE